MNTETPYAFFSELAKHAAKLFRDPFSPLTRKRQSALLITSIAVVLLSLAIVSPIEGSAAGVKFKISDLSAFKQLLGIVLMYLMIVYIIGVSQDLKAYQYRMLPVQAGIRQKMHQLHRDVLERGGRVASYNETFFGELWEERQSIGTALEATRKEYDKQYGHLAEEFHKLTDELLSSEFDHRSEDYKKLVEERNSTCDEMKRISDEFETKRQNYLDQFDDLSTQGHDLADATTHESEHIKTEAAKMEQLLKPILAYKRLNILRTWIEVIFPIVLCLYAIWVSLIRTWFI